MKPKKESTEDKLLKNLFFIILLLGFGIVIGLILTTHNGADAIETKALDEVCHLLYGNNTEYVSTYFGIDSKFNCREIKPTITKESKSLVRLIQ